MMTVSDAIQETLKADTTFAKFLSANDTGETGGHQVGVYIPKNSYKLLFDKKQNKGKNATESGKLMWADGKEVDISRKYYGEKTRNEYRMTKLWTGTPYQSPEYTGALLVINKIAKGIYNGYVFNKEDEINEFLNTFGLLPTDINCLINEKINFQASPKEKKVEEKVKEFLDKLNKDFPTTAEMSELAQTLYNEIWNEKDKAVSNPDKRLIEWADMEFKIYSIIEKEKFEPVIFAGFNNVEEFLKLATSITNKRKSRAGYSLQNHLETLFKINGLQFTPQAVTEGRKKPDFIFPSVEAYHNPDFPDDKLVILGVKTTCKDRWRQVITEANRMKEKRIFLFTLQQGISAAQLDEMKEANVTLVVPKPYIETFPESHQESIWTLKDLIEYVQELEKEESAVESA